MLAEDDAKLAQNVKILPSAGSPEKKTDGFTLGKEIFLVPIN